MSGGKESEAGALPAGWKNESHIDANWLGQLVEPVIDPELPIIDPHHHLWDQPQHRYLEGELVADLRSGHDIRSTVYVEASSFCDQDARPELRSLGETRFVTGVAEAARKADGPRICAGIIGFAALRLGAAACEVIEKHVEISKGRLKGIRNVSIWDETLTLKSIRSDPPRGLLADRGFREGFADLGRFGLAFDAFVYHTQLGELADLAESFPETSIVVDHLGGPIGIAQYEGRRQEVMSVWTAGLRRLSRLPNVFIKLGGLGMPYAGFGLRGRPSPAPSAELAVVWKPYIHTAIDLFGPTRCMFESNFPVENEICSYRTLWNAFKCAAASYSAEEKQWLFHDTARAVYKLD